METGVQPHATYSAVACLGFIWADDAASIER